MFKNELAKSVYCTPSWSAHLPWVVNASPSPSPSPSPQPALESGQRSDSDSNSTAPAHVCHVCRAQEQLRCCSIKQASGSGSGFLAHTHTTPGNTAASTEHKWDPNMFFRMVQKRALDVHPKHLGPRLRETLASMLANQVGSVGQAARVVLWWSVTTYRRWSACWQVEGASHGCYGYIIAVTEILGVSQVLTQPLWTDCQKRRTLTHHWLLPRGSSEWMVRGM